MKEISFFSYQGNVNKNYNEIPSDPSIKTIIGKIIN